MSIIRQESLFDLQDLYNIEPTQNYDAILSCIDMDSILVRFVLHRLYERHFA
ncbi:hypothetical protein EV207_10891 [Scopulibacillus darangshiensis]|uniref:Uncharacterized protein n=1 Tax=Scopulibacillus darangshiensis TaxID=442528 RepID=A0A4R2P4Q1_9BACL|nr:hypothetical protein EV207_10891 [Scopulibacillus darangshiensis]